MTIDRHSKVRLQRLRPNADKLRKTRKPPKLALRAAGGAVVFNCLSKKKELTPHLEKRCALAKTVRSR